MIQILEEETVCDTDVVDTFSAVGLLVPGVIIRQLVSVFGLLVPEVIIHPLVSVFGHYWNLQFLDNVTIINTKVLLPQT